MLLTLYFLIACTNCTNILGLVIKCRIPSYRLANYCALATNFSGKSLGLCLILILLNILLNVMVMWVYVRVLMLLKGNVGRPTSYKI